MTNKSISFLHLVHVLVEVLISSHLKQMEVISDIRQSPTPTELLSQPGDL